MAEHKTHIELAREAIDKGAVATNPLDIAKEEEEKYMNALYECVANHKQLWPSKNFFVHTTMRCEPFARNEFKNFWTGHIDCPSPTYDQTLYHYIANGDRIELLWSIPNEEHARAFKQYAHNIKPEFWPTLQVVLDFYDGKLSQLARKLNNEPDNMPEVVLKEFYGDDQEKLEYN